MSIARRRKKAKYCYSRSTGKRVSCAAQRAGRKAWRSRKGSRRSVCKFGRVKAGPRKGRCRKVRLKPCKAYAIYRRPDGTLQTACAARSAKALLNKVWPASFTGTIMTPAEYRAARSTIKAQNQARRAARRGFFAPAAATMFSTGTSPAGGTGSPFVTIGTPGPTPGAMPGTPSQRRAARQAAGQWRAATP